MAEENLGKAVLRIEVDIPNFEKDLNKARNLVEKQKPLNFKLDISDSKQQFLKLEASARTLERQLKNLLATPLNINSKNLEKLGADALTAGTAINQFTRQVLNGEKPIANSIAAIQQQGTAFRTLAANVKIGSTEFNNFAQAAIKASQKELFAGFQEIGAAQKLFTLGGAGGVDTFKGTEQLLAYSRSIGKTPAAIQLYISALQQALSLTSTADSNFGRLTLEIQNQAAALERAGNAATRYNQIFNLGAQPKALPPGRGPSQFVFTGEETPEERRARERSERRAAKIQDIQKYVSTGGLDPLQGFNFRLARPDPEAIKQEQQLGLERRRTTKATSDAVKAEERNRQQAVKRSKEIAGNAIIGGAFPLLFGQGIGASVGGFAGGAAGGAIGGQFGFGLSLVGTALGAQFDTAIQKSGELAKALDKPIAQFGALQQGALLSSKGVEKQIEALIASGREAEAAALIQQDLNKIFGDAQGAKEYQSAVDRLNRSYSQATVTLTNFVAGPLASLLERILGPTRNTQLSARLLSQKARLTPEQTKEFAAFTAAEKKRQNIGIGSSSVQITAFYASLLEKITEIQGKNNDALAVAARNQKVLTQSAQTLAGLEADISRARISGNKPLADSLSLQAELLKNYNERINIEQQLAADNISAGQSTKLTRQSFARDKQLQQDYVNTTKQAAADAVKELQITKQLVGLDGVRLDVARKRLDIDDSAETLFKRRTEFINARETLTRKETDLNKTLAQGAFQEFATAGAQFETKLRQAADYLTKAAKDAAQNLTTSILNLGKLEASRTGLNRFLTPNEQSESTRKAILRLGEGAGTAQGSQLENAITKATELLGLTRGQANERFQGLRNIFAQARQGGFVSETGFNAVSQFIEDTRARSQAVTGLNDAQKTLADITSLSASVQQELVGAVQENSLLLSNLFGKDWSVNVSVAGAEANITGDVTNRQISP